MMDNLSVRTLSDLRRDLVLRGYTDSQILEFLNTPVLLIPGPITSEGSDIPAQKLTNHIAFISKDLQQYGIPNQIVLRKDVPKSYIEERYAHVDLGTIVISLMTLEQLGALGNIAQILDLFLNLVQLRFATGRTRELMSNVRMSIVIHNGEKSATWDMEGPADAVTKLSSPSRIREILSGLGETLKND